MIFNDIQNFINVVIISYGYTGSSKIIFFTRNLTHFENRKVRISAHKLKMETDV
jgi:hypothetical protein